MNSRMFFTLFIILTVLGGYSCKKEVIVPDELLGIWTTSAPKYEGCYFKLSLDEIAIADIEGDVNFYKIEKIEIEEVPGEERILYIITYADLEGSDYEFSIYYDPEDEGTIRWKNQPNIVWMKSEAE